MNKSNTNFGGIKLNEFGWKIALGYSIGQMEWKPSYALFRLSITKTNFMKFSCLFVPLLSIAQRGLDFDWKNGLSNLSNILG